MSTMSFYSIYFKIVYDTYTNRSIFTEILQPFANFHENFSKTSTYKLLYAVNIRKYVFQVTVL